MALSDATDVVVAALAELLRRNVPVYLADEVDDSSPTEVVAVRRVYEYPIATPLLPSVQLPALIVFRRQTSWEDVGKRSLRRTSIRIDYVQGPAPASRLEARWALLHRVFEAVVKAICADEYVDQAGSSPLEDAGVLQFWEDATTVSYDYITDQGHANAYPMFQASFVFTHEPREPAVSESALSPYRGMTATYTLTDPSDISRVNDVDLATDDIVNVAFTRAFDLGYESPGDN